MACLAVAAILSGGCVTSSSRAIHGKTIYVGGAGNIGPFGTGEIGAALLMAGYDGQYEPFIWQSGRGAFSDQTAINRNQRIAISLAERLKRYIEAYPNAPLDIIALSAGCGITAFALEQLPPNYHVNNVVFLGCSLSNRYDLRPALNHIRGGLYVYTSSSDLVLNQIVPRTGTVDRRRDLAAGLNGFIPPTNLSEDGRRLYRKVVQIPWRREFMKYGWMGQHLDSVNYRFIRHEVAGRLATPPLLTFGPAPRLARHPTTQPAAAARRQPATVDPRRPARPAPDPTASNVRP